MSRQHKTSYVSGADVADATGRRHGRIISVIGRGEFVVRWSDNTSTQETEQSVMLRYTTQTKGF